MGVDWERVVGHAEITLPPLVLHNNWQGQWRSPSQHSCYGVSNPHSIDSKTFHLILVVGCNVLPLLAYGASQPCVAMDTFLLWKV